MYWCKIIISSLKKFGFWANIGDQVEIYDYHYVYTCHKNQSIYKILSTTIVKFISQIQIFVDNRSTRRKKK